MARVSFLLSCVDSPFKAYYFLSLQQVIGHYSNFPLLRTVQTSLYSSLLPYCCSQLCLKLILAYRKENIWISQSSWYNRSESCHGLGPRKSSWILKPSSSYPRILFSPYMKKVNLFDYIHYGAALTFTYRYDLILPLCPPRNFSEVGPSASHPTLL